MIFMYDMLYIIVVYENAWRDILMVKTLVHIFTLFC